MKLRVVSIGTKAPAWVDAGFVEYAKRLPRQMPLELVQIPPAKHHLDKTKFLLEEGDKMLHQLDNTDWVIALDERGKAVASRDLAGRFEVWRNLGANIVFLVGGSDGLSPGVLQRANERMSLSNLTFPHYLVRVILAETLYRAWSIYSGHPYHRE